MIQGQTKMPIYLDYNATTPCDPRVLETMLPWFSVNFGNPHSADHKYGWDAAEAVEKARKQLAKLIGAQSKEIYFTSGATEANNLAIKGVARATRALNGRNRILTFATEHKCVLETVRYLTQEGFEIEILPVDTLGAIDLELLEARLEEDVALVSVMAANNEIGILHPMKEIAALTHKYGAYLHCDAAQAVGKIPIDLRTLGVDLMSISGHKFYAPKGVGALYIRKKSKISIDPMMSGGGQERGVRSGTLSPPLCVGLGKAAEIAAQEIDEEAQRLSRLRDQMWREISTSCQQVSLNGPLENRLPGNLNITIPGIEGGEFMAQIGQLAISGGSACSSGHGSHSHVLEAIGHDPKKVAAGIRIGIGRFTTDEDIQIATSMLIKTINYQVNL